MQLSIVGRHIEITAAIKEYVEKRLQKLKKYFPYVVDVHVVLYTQKINQVAEVTILANRYTIHGEERSQDLYASIDMVIEKLDAQLKKYKERLVQKHQRQQRKEKELNLNISVYEREELERSDIDLEENHAEPQIVHTQRMAIKPMSVDEAVMQMDLIDQDFLVFLNSSSEGMNILFRRKDGQYGLIVPDLA